MMRISALFLPRGLGGRNRVARQCPARSKAGERRHHFRGPGEQTRKREDRVSLARLWPRKTRGPCRRGELCAFEKEVKEVEEVSEVKDSERENRKPFRAGRVSFPLPPLLPEPPLPHAFSSRKA